MATADVLTSTIASLQTLATPNAATQALITQRDSLLAQVATLQAQIDTAMAGDPALAQQTINQLQNIQQAQAQQAQQAAQRQAQQAAQAAQRAARLAAQNQGAPAAPVTPGP